MTNTSNLLQITINPTQLAHIILGLQLVQNLEGEPQDSFRLASIPEEEMQKLLTDVEGLQGELLSIEWLDELRELLQEQAQECLLALEGPVKPSPNTSANVQGCATRLY